MDPGLQRKTSELMNSPIWLVNHIEGSGVVLGVKSETNLSALKKLELKLDLPDPSLILANDTGR